MQFQGRPQSKKSQDVLRVVRDCALLRADGIRAYQLAVGVDEAAQEITAVVPGADLVSSRPRQIVRERSVGVATPRYMRIPVAMNARGEKLSKQTRAPESGVEDLPAALRFAGMPPPADLQGKDLMMRAVKEWSVNSLPARPAIPLPDGLLTAGSDGSPRAR